MARLYQSISHNIQYAKKLQSVRGEFSKPLSQKTLSLQKNFYEIDNKCDFSLYLCGTKTNIFLTNLIIMERKDPIEEARRYVANAEEIIKKANYDSELNIYTDGKYIKMAGNTLWNGCLVALDAALGIRKGKGRPSIEKYQQAAGQRDRKLLAAIVAGYSTMHLSMGYDGVKSKKVCAVGFEYANTIINRCALLYPKPDPAQVS